MKTKYTRKIAGLCGLLGLTLGTFIVPEAAASSHMDAPLVTLDPAANTTDVYAFLTRRNGVKYLQVALGVYPHQEPGVGPNKYNFDDKVLYQIFVSTGTDVAAGRDTIAYQFQFNTAYKNDSTILQSYVGVVQNVDDSAQNLTQSYTVTKVTGSTSVLLGSGKVPPNNQGVATPKYNQSNDGNMPAKAGVNDPASLDPYTAQAIATLSNGYRTFAGQREDGFYGDIQSVFDLLSLRSGAGNTFDSQGGYNMHMIVLEIPVSELGNDQQVVGVYATTSRRAMQVLSTGVPALTGNWVQVGRQGNPLFCEALVGIKDKDLYNRTKPTEDATLFKKYAETPELAALINAILFAGQKVAVETNRTDLVGIFIPDLIKVDLSTEPARLTGGNSDDTGFSRMSVFGGDALMSTVQAGFGGGTVAGGWPNGRRFGDDVIDIAVSAILSDLRTAPLKIVPADGIDNVSRNDSIYSKVFPYAATPHNGRNYAHNPRPSFVSPLMNISTRGFIGNGENLLIGGFIVRGQAPVKVLVRSVGPSLAGFTTAIGDTILTLHEGQRVINTNDDWKTSQRTAIEATGFAPTNDKEAAILVTLNPGIYTAIVQGKNGATGVGMVEVFLVD